MQHRVFSGLFHKLLLAVSSCIFVLAKRSDSGVLNCWARLSLVGRQIVLSLLAVEGLDLQCCKVKPAGTPSSVFARPLQQQRQNVTPQHHNIQSCSCHLALFLVAGPVFFLCLRGFCPSARRQWTEITPFVDKEKKTYWL
eukprot:1161585-Pelagomonas_calceolata.AAC.25